MSTHISHTKIIKKTKSSASSAKKTVKKKNIFNPADVLEHVKKKGDKMLTDIDDDGRTWFDLFMDNPKYAQKLHADELALFEDLAKRKPQYAMIYNGIKASYDDAPLSHNIQNDSMCELYTRGFLYDSATIDNTEKIVELYRKKLYSVMKKPDIVKLIRQFFFKSDE